MRFIYCILLTQKSFVWQLQEIKDGLLFVIDPESGKSGCISLTAVEQFWQIPEKEAKETIEYIKKSHEKSTIITPPKGILH